MGEPLVSVVIPAYNAGAYLRPAVESVLCQTYRNLDVLVIDDGSTDGSIGTLAGIDDPRMRVIRQRNAGKPSALNRAIDESRAEFYVVNDADDWSHPERIERQVSCMLAKPHVAGVFTGHDLIVNGRRTAPQFRMKDEAECRRDIAEFRMPGHDPTPMYRMDMVREFKFDPQLPVAEGLDYILRIGEQFPLVVLGECLYSYRIHQASITKRARDLCNACVWEVLRRACERRGLDFEERFGAQVARTESGRVRNMDRDNNLAAHFIESVLDLRAQGRLIDAIKTGIFCGRIHPTDPHYLKAFAYAVLPQFVVHQLRGQRAVVPPPSNAITSAPT